MQPKNKGIAWAYLIIGIAVLLISVVLSLVSCKTVRGDAKRLDGINRRHPGLMDHYNAEHYPPREYDSIGPVQYIEGPEVVHTRYQYVNCDSLQAAKAAGADVDTRNVPVQTSDTNRVDTAKELRTRQVVGGAAYDTMARSNQTLRTENTKLQQRLHICTRWLIIGWIVGLVFFAATAYLLIKKISVKSIL